MSRQFTRDFILEIAKGDVAGHSIMSAMGEWEGGSIDTDGSVGWWGVLINN